MGYLYVVGPFMRKTTIHSPFFINVWDCWYSNINAKTMYLSRNLKIKENKEFMKTEKYIFQSMLKKIINLSKSTILTNGKYCLI